MFGIFQLLAERSPSFAKSSAALSVPALSDKLGDMKLKKPAGDAMTAFAEKTSLGFVLSLGACCVSAFSTSDLTIILRNTPLAAYEPMSKQKAPKAQADSMVWVDQAIRDFGITGLSVREVIEFLKVGLKSSNAAVRTNATKTLVTLKLYVGSGTLARTWTPTMSLLLSADSRFDRRCQTSRASSETSTLNFSLRLSPNSPKSTASRLLIPLVSAPTLSSQLLPLLAEEERKVARVKVPLWWKTTLSMSCSPVSTWIACCHRRVLLLAAMPTGRFARRPWRRSRASWRPTSD